MTLSKSTVGLSCILFFLVPSEINSFSLNARLGHPPFSGLDPANSLLPRQVCFSDSGVGHILRTCARPQIRPSIVQGIMIVMVHMLRVTSDDEPVHEDRVTIFPLGGPVAIKRSDVFDPYGIPIPPHETIVVIGVNNGVLSLREGYESDRLVLRLDNFVSSYTSFRHDLTSNEIVRRPAAPSQISITDGQ